MSKENRKRLIIVIIIILIVAAAVFVLTKMVRSTNADKKNSAIDSPTISQAKTSQASNSDKPSTIASKWQWQTTSKQADVIQAENQPTSLPFTPQSIYDALQAVNVDVNGDIVLDHDALISLDEALERIYNRLDSNSLLALQDIIKEALPGKVGEQTAKIVEDYVSFLKAKDEFSQINESIANLNAVQTTESLEKDQVLYAELQELREIHLGNQASSSLFRVADANAQFMFDSLKLSVNTNLSTEEKEIRRGEIQTRFDEQLGNDAN